MPLEPTSRTGLRHVAGAVTMARFDQPDSATGNFSILVGASPSMDAHGKSLGYAVFGRVVAGMDVVKRILAEPAGGGSGAMRGQVLARPVQILRAQRLDGRPHPSGRPKPWTLGDLRDTSPPPFVLSLSKHPCCLEKHSPSTSSGRTV